MDLEEMSKTGIETDECVIDTYENEIPKLSKVERFAINSFLTIALVIPVVLLLWGVWDVCGLSQWFVNLTDPAPEGREALIWRYYEGLETGDYEIWQVGYDGNGDVCKGNNKGILLGIGLDVLWDEEYLREEYRYLKRQYGEGFEISYEIDDIHLMDDDQLIRFNQYFKRIYPDYPSHFAEITTKNEEGINQTYYGVTDKAWIYELYIEIDGEDDDTAFKKNFVVYQVDDRLYVEPMNYS